MRVNQLGLVAAIIVTFGITSGLNACSGDTGGDETDISETTPDVADDTAATDTTVQTDSAGPDGDAEPVRDADIVPADVAPADGVEVTPDTHVTDDIDDTVEPGDAEGCLVNADCEYLSADMPCHISVCEFGTCLTVQSADNTACDDGNPCTVDNLCMEAVCTGVEDLAAEGCASVAVCDSAIEIDTLPYTSTSTTIGGAGYFSSTDCPGAAEGKGGGSNDALYILNVVETGAYVFAMTDMGEDPEGLDTVLYLLDGCPGLTTSTCLGAQDIWFKYGREEITLDLTAGSQIFVVVDGYAWDENIEGNFELTVTRKQPPETDCGDGEDNDDDGSADCADPGCAETAVCLAEVPGALCANAIVIDSLPFQHQGTTEDMGNEVHVAEETCPDTGDSDSTLSMLGGASDDVFFAFTPTADAAYVITLDTEGEEDTYENLVVALYEGVCPSGLLTDLCLMGDNSYTDGGELILAELIGGTTYFIVIDGWDNDHDVNGAYSLRVEEIAHLPVGALAITELMGNPDSPVNDGDGEWMEIRNTTAEEQPLKGLWLTYRSWSDGDTMPAEPANTYVISEETSIGAGGNIVIVKSADTGVNGGLFVGVEYGSISLSNNGSKSIALQLVNAAWNGAGEPPAGLVVDALTLPSGTFSGPGKGASFQLDEDRASNADAAAMNDWAYRWCHTPKEAAFTYHEGNYGSPYQPNGHCEGADGPPPMTYEDDVLPIYVIRCGGCHTDGPGCFGGGCWDVYEDLTSPSGYCGGVTKAECTSIRIHDGTMPQGNNCSGDPELDIENAGCLTAEEQQIIDWWIEGGMALE